MRIIRNQAQVHVSATSANLGPGFDSLGLALEIRDTYQLTVTPQAETKVSVIGEGAETVPLDDSHLVVKTIRETLDLLGAPQVGIQLQCHNLIPHGRGLGSSAAAIVGALALVRGIISDPEVLSDAQMLNLATQIEGHPDNVAPAIYGGVTLGYSSGAENTKAVQLPVGRDRFGIPYLAPIVISPNFELATSKARALLPEQVPLEAAAFNAARTALFAHAIEHQPELIFDATADQLHQDYRAEAMGQSMELVRSLRAEGIPAVISGAGPTVLIPAQAPAGIAYKVQQMLDQPEQWRIARVPLAENGVETVLR